MNKITCLMLLFCASIFTSKAQESERRKLAYQIGYFGETLSHPGLNLGIEYYPLHSGKVQSILVFNLGGYMHYRNNTSLFIRGQWGQRATFGSGIFVEQFLGLGYLHQFTHGGALYTVLPNGALVEESKRGLAQIMPCLSLGTGYDFSVKGNKKVTIYLRPELFWKAPFNGYYLTHFAINAGIIIKR